MPLIHVMFNGEVRITISDDQLETLQTKKFDGDVWYSIETRISEGATSPYSPKINGESWTVVEL